MFSDIRVISFDLDDTLWPCKSVIQRAEQQLYAWLTEHAPEIPASYGITAMREHRQAFMRKYPHIAHDLTMVRQGSLKELMSRHGYPSALATQATAFFREARNQVDPYPDALPVLAKLRTRYLLVSVTNGNAEIDKTPLRDCFHRSFTAAEAGAARPAPALFKAVLDWSGVAPKAVLHVGDDADRDVKSAHLMGMRTAWMQRGHRQWKEADAAGVAVDVVVTNLHQLARLLEKGAG